MGNMTYEQFEHWCKQYNYTIEEGYRAMCFVKNVITQNFANRTNYMHKVCADNENDDMIKDLVKKLSDDSALLSVFYKNLNTMIFDMLKKHYEETGIEGDFLK